MNGSWERIAIGGKPADVFAPADGKRPRFGVLFLHDVDQATLRDKPAFARWFDDWNLACVCPLGLDAWRCDRIWSAFDPLQSPETYLFQHVVPFFQTCWGLLPRGLGLLGVGMGGQGALRLAFKHSASFPVVAAIAPSLEYHELYHSGTPIDDLYASKEQCRQDTAIMHVPPHHPPPHIFYCTDPEDIDWFRGADRLHEKMNALGVPHQIDLTTSAGGHTWTYYNHMAERALRFLLAGLEQESRRLL